MKIDKQSLEKILGRKEHDVSDILDAAAYYFTGKNIMITGALGSLGQSLNNFIKEYNINCNVKNIDIDKDVAGMPSGSVLDVCNYYQMMAAFSVFNPDLVFHFAADKHAPHGESSPCGTVNVNIDGTKNLIECAAPYNCKIVLASTCKSCNPETVYGASKLIAERMALNSGHSVARYYNVVETSGNVFDIWKAGSVDNKVANCKRYFISLKEALTLTLFVSMQDNGRYTINPGNIRNMPDIYLDLFGYYGSLVPPRRGDRVVELRLGTAEKIVPVSHSPFEEIISGHDQAL